MINVLAQFLAVGDHFTKLYLLFLLVTLLLECLRRVVPNALKLEWKTWVLAATILRAAWLQLVWYDLFLRPLINDTINIDNDDARATFQRAGGAGPARWMDEKGESELARCVQAATTRRCVVLACLQQLRDGRDVSLATFYLRRETSSNIQRLAIPSPATSPTEFIRAEASAPVLSFFGCPRTLMKMLHLESNGRKKLSLSWTENFETQLQSMTSVGFCGRCMQNVRCHWYVCILQPRDCRKR